MSSRACAQDRPMPRCAVSMASATPNPWSHRKSLKPMVDSQSIPPPGRAATCAAGNFKAASAAARDGAADVEKLLRGDPGDCKYLRVLSLALRHLGRSLAA